MKSTTTIAVLFAACALSNARVPIAPGAELKLVADGYKFTEGPAADSAGDVYFTDQPNDRILKWDAASSKVETFLQPAGRSNGLSLDHEGRLLACADEKGQLWRIDLKTKRKEVLLDNFQDKLFNGPNDVWVDPKGGVFFTDPFYKRDYWSGREQPEQDRQRVFYLAKDAKTPVIADDSMVQPNGLIGSEDGRQLFVADIGDRKTYRFDITAGGKLENRTLFCTMGSDGMTRDVAGNVYLTGKGVIVFDKGGQKIGEIPVPESWTANVTFGGKDLKTLFITAMDSVYTLEMEVAGYRP